MAIDAPFVAPVGIDCLCHDILGKAELQLWHVEDYQGESMWRMEYLNQHAQRGYSTVWHTEEWARMRYQQALVRLTACSVLGEDPPFSIEDLLGGLDV